METNKLLAFAVDAAVSGGKILLNQKSSVVKCDLGHDIKLQADTDSEHKIISILQNTGINILSEEFGYIEQDSKSSLRWIIDPLDGSLNYVRHIPIFCISIALWNNDEPVFGVIYDYVHDSLYKGVVGENATLNNKLIHVSDIQLKSKAILATGFPVYSSFDNTTLTHFVSDFQSYKKVRLFGSAAFSLVMVAQGSVDAYYENNIAWWDVAAGIAIVLAAGGKVNFKFTDREKNLLNVVATNVNLK